MTNGAVIDALMQGPKVRVVKTFKVTIPEGRSRRESAPAVDESGIEGSYLKASGSRAALARARKLGAPKRQQDARGLPVPGDLRAEGGGDRRRPRRQAARRVRATTSARSTCKARAAQEPDPLRRADHRLDDRARDAVRQGAPAGRLGDLQPPQARGAARHRRHDPLRREQLVRAAASSPSSTGTRRTTRASRRGCRRRRSATRGSPRSGRRRIRRTRTTSSTSSSRARATRSPRPTPSTSATSPPTRRRGRRTAARRRAQKC